MLSDRFPQPLRRRLSRRSLLSASARAGVGAVGIALVGCSDDEDSQQQVEQPQQSQTQQGQAQQQTAQTQQQQAQQQTDQTNQQQVQQQEQAADPTGPAHGGILRAWLPVDRHDRWDPHRSRYRYTQAALSLMYSRILRPRSVQSGELEADLCALPETPDELTYIFSLDPQAVFWNQEPALGRSVTATDLRWNIERQQSALDANGIPDPHFFRRSAYQRVAFSSTPDDDTLALNSSGPDATFLASVHASPFAWIVNPEAADLHGDTWRDDPQDIFLSAGSGPYTPRSYDGFQLALVRSENWWQPDSGYANGIIFESADPNSIGGYYDSQLVDRADFPLTNGAIEALREQYPEHPTYEQPLGSSIELIAPQSADTASSLSDPRVIRAIDLAIDRARLLQRLYGGQGQLAGPVSSFLAGWSLSEQLLGSMPGYRDDRAADLDEATQLIDAAGGADALSSIPFRVADLFEGFFPGAGEAVRSMIANATGLDVALEYQPFDEAIDQLRDGERFLFLGWGEVPRQADPTDGWLSTLHSSGERRWSDGVSDEVDNLLDQMKSTFNLAARQDLAHQVQELLLSGDAPQWQINLVSGTQLGLHQPWLHPDPRLFEYAWSTDRLSTSWLETWHESYPVDRELPPEPEAEADAEPIEIQLDPEDLQSSEPIEIELDQSQQSSGE